MSRKERAYRFKLSLLFSMVVFVIMAAALAIAGAIIYLMVRYNVVLNRSISVGSLVVAMAAACLIVGTVIALAVSKIPLYPINRLISRMKQLAKGDFTVRLEYGKPLGNHAVFKQLSESFNAMAEELQNTEMLRGDFINNFSHEFKTPIVSIAGFAKLLKRGNLTDAQKSEYLDIIESESLRLAAMATNVLNLTKVENQSILTDVTEYNLSEQIRGCLLLLEDKWSKKDIDLRLDFDEYNVIANRELMKQVWINLADNAIKFAPRGGRVEIDIERDTERLRVSVKNEGAEIAPENRTKIFNKFYQEESSHTGEGNGVGLAIVKRVVELHKGEICVECEGGYTTFTVTL